MTHYCVIISGDDQLILQNNVLGINGAVQGALNVGCVLQGGVGSITWKLGNGQNMFGFVQAVSCPSPCFQVMRSDKNGNTIINYPGVDDQDGVVGRADATCNGAAELSTRHVARGMYWYIDTDLTNHNSAHSIRVTVRCKSSVFDPPYDHYDTHPLAAGETKVISSTIDDGRQHYYFNIVGCEMNTHSEEL